MLVKKILLAITLPATLGTAINTDALTKRTMNSDTLLEAFLKTHTPEDRTHLIQNNKANTTSLEADNQARSMGTAIIGNRCPYDVWVWSVDQNGSSKRIHVPKRTRYSEPFRAPCDGCGASFKVSRTNQLVSGKHTQFEYSIAGGQLWYDISFVDCAKGKNAGNCPGHEKGLAIDSPNAACGRANCKAGSYCPTQAYYVDTPVSKLGLPEPVFGCGSAGTGMKLYMKMCSSEPPIKRSIAGRIFLDDEA